MLCSISGDIPKDPVLSTTTRLIYERSVVERAIGETGQCPVTGEALAADSLVPVRVPTVRTPHPASGTTGVIRILSKEWDDLTLEVFGLRQQLDQTRRELATALYQHDAACRVVARLLRERDEAVNLLTQGGVRMEIDSEAQEPQEEDLGTMPGQLLEELNGACAELSGARKHRKISEEVVRKEVLGAWGANGTRISLPSSPTCIDICSTSLIAGTSTGSVETVDLATHRNASFSTNNTPVSAVLAGQDSIYTIAGPVMSLWSPKGGNMMSFAHNSEVTAITTHSRLPLAITCTEEAWQLFDVRKGAKVLQVPAQGLTACKLHPDGLVLGLGTRSGDLGIWDIRTLKQVSALSEHSNAITAVDFSENGYLCATSSVDGSVKVWDLRKLKCTKTLPALGTARFDFSGTYLAIAGAAGGPGGAGGKLAVHVVKDWSELFTATHTSAFTGVAWGQHAQTLVASASDGLLLYGK